MDSVEEKIIGATIECIERYGIDGATNRRIASVAGVNSAAINYYFRRKEVLLERCMQASLDNAFDWGDIEQLPGRTAKERCAAIFLHLIEGALNYPGMTRAHFHNVITQGDYDSPAVKRLNEFIDKLVEHLDQLGTRLERTELRLASQEIASAAFMIMVAPRLLAGSGLDIEKEADRRVFIERLVDRLL